MPLGVFRISTDDYPPVPQPCLRCGATTELRFAGPCPSCTAELHEKFRGEARDVDTAAYEPKMNVTPNAVALKDD